MGNSALILEAKCRTSRNYFGHARRRGVPLQQRRVYPPSNKVIVDIPMEIFTHSHDCILECSSQLRDFLQNFKTAYFEFSNQLDSLISQSSSIAKLQNVLSKELERLPIDLVAILSLKNRLEITTRNCMAGLIDLTSKWEFLVGIMSSFVADHPEAGGFTNLIETAKARVVEEQRKRVLLVANLESLIAEMKAFEKACSDSGVSQNPFGAHSPSMRGKTDYNIMSPSTAFKPSNLGSQWNGEEFGEDVLRYHIGALKGDCAAQYDLAVCFDMGQGIRQDTKQAVAWYTMAASHGHVNAQFNLAICYETGSGVAPDHQMAIHWFREAAQQGDDEAIRALKMMAK